MKWYSYLLPFILISNQSLVADIKINGTQLAGLIMLGGGIYHATKERPKKEDRTFRDSFLVSLGLISSGTVLATDNVKTVVSGLVALSAGGLLVGIELTKNLTRKRY